ncbi:MAG: hypothetical protein HOW73_33490 [Polyangiaceae bacterium]|nr:hypothetical protein [Polyangiaceae bacterium]
MPASRACFVSASLLFVLGIVGCGDKPAEPERAAPPSTAHTTSAAPATAGWSGETEAPPPGDDATLAWDAPGGWNVTETSKTGPRRMGYSVPRVGDDKEDAELLVLYFGKGKNGERDAQWDSWFGQFDGDAKKDAKRETFPVGDNTVETFEFIGNYKLNMGRQVPGMKRSPVQMVKKDFRMIGAVVKTKARGNWFFRLVGPDKTVLAAKDGFVEMLKSVR